MDPGGRAAFGRAEKMVADTNKNDYHLSANNHIPGETPMLRLIAAALLATSLGAFAADGDVTLVIENHKFTPDRVEIPAGKKVKFIIDNRDATAEEFESHDLKIEKVIPAKSKGTVFVGPLKAGEYKFVGEFNEKTAKGVIVAK